MTSAAEYSQYAGECLQAAGTTTSPEVKATLLAMAQHELADNAERNAHLPPKPE